MLCAEITVVIPCYNGERWIGRAIGSVLNQKYPRTEIIVVDDGSTDASRRIISEFTKNVALYECHRQGACSARNFGLSKVSSDYVMFLDADDYLEGPLFSGAAEKLSENSCIDMLFSPLAVELPSGERLLVDNFKCTPNPFGLFRDWSDHLAQPPCSLIWRTQFIRAIGGWDPRVLRNQDGELVMRAALSMPKIGYNALGRGVYNRHDQPSLSKCTSAEVVQSEYAALARLLASAKGTEFENHANGLARKFYGLAHAAFSVGDINTGRSAHKMSRELGFRGHIGTPFHRVSASIFGLEAKARVVRAARKLNSCWPSLDMS